MQQELSAKWKLFLSQNNCELPLLEIVYIGRLRLKNDWKINY